MSLMSHLPQSSNASGLSPLDGYAFEPFEAALLPVIRHLLTALRQPETQAWHRAFVIAGEHWGEVQGFAVAYALWPLVRRLEAIQGARFASNDPLDLDLRGLVTVGEVQLLAMLHYMRRDETRLARDALELLTEGRMDPDLIRAGLSFADRFPSGARMRLRGGVELRAVS